MHTHRTNTLAHTHNFSDDTEISCFPISPAIHALSPHTQIYVHMLSSCHPLLYLCESVLACVDAYNSFFSTLIRLVATYYYYKYICAEFFFQKPKALSLPPLRFCLYHSIPLECISQGRKNNFFSCVSICKFVRKRSPHFDFSITFFPCTRQVSKAMECVYFCECVCVRVYSTLFFLIVVFDVFFFFFPFSFSHFVFHGLTWISWNMRESLIHQMTQQNGIWNFVKYTIKWDIVDDDDANNNNNNMAHLILI